MSMSRRFHPNLTSTRQKRANVTVIQRMGRRRALGLLLALPAVAARADPLAQVVPAEIPIGRNLPDVFLDGLNGPSRRLSAYRGKPLLINVWASWCGPCIEEMASLERLAWLEGRPAFTVIGISTDDYRDRALSWLRRSNATLTHFIDHDQQLEGLLGAQHIPLTVVVDAAGVVRARTVGSRRWDAPEAVAWIARAIQTGVKPRGERA
jgi:thiol-disulfide isomerase/thioredoxin